MTDLYVKLLILIDDILSLIRNAGTAPRIIRDISSDWND
ncbi:hypothetical protein THF5H11_260014 [Vibrio jasicida]|nr:hypothetical protein THF5H11_260014 [Vibrio jasicida]